MVSFHTPDLSSPSPPPLPRTRTCPVPQELECNSKKRKFCYESNYEEFYDKSVRVHQNMMNYLTNTDHHLHLETPLPSEWQQCLDIKSGKLYFYNTRTQKKTSSDPRSSPELSTPTTTTTTTTTDHHMSLELALNLPCDNSMSNKNHHHHQVTENFTKFLNHHDHQLTNSSAKIISKNIDTVTTTGLGLSRSPSWLTMEREGEEEEEEEEMVTAVCNKCHMLVMMSKSLPSCPNCKFIHSPDNTTPTLFKRSLTTLLC